VRASWLACALCACTASSPAVDGGRSSEPAPTQDLPAPAGTEAPTAAPTGTGAPAADAIAGKWVSPSCGGRKYAREIDLSAAGTFTSRDLVSPCPPKVACVWSGIVDRSGQWSRQGDKIVLTVDGGADQKPGVALPAELTLEGGALVETEGGGVTCAYARP